MKKEQEKWRSPSLGKDMKLTIYGESGTPIIGFPTRGQDSEEWEKNGMTEALGHQLSHGYNQLFCVDTVDEESFLNSEVVPHKRLMRHEQYESYIIEEVLPFISQQNAVDYLMIAGFDLGAYHAVNLALKHPGEFNKVIGISGVYNVKKFFENFYNDDLYFNNPVDFVSNISKQELLNKIREIDFRIVSYVQDSRKEETMALDDLLRKKFIDHQLEVWEDAAQEEWDLWHRMLTSHII